MTHRLSPVHFKPQPRVPVSAMPTAVTLASLIASVCSKTLSRFANSSWRVALDRIEEGRVPPGDAHTNVVRFESARGSLGMQIALDRSAISALIEAMMGGNGTEAPFDLGERPLSRIESSILGIICSALAAELAELLSRHFGRPFSHFENSEVTVATPGDREQATFRFLVNVFGYSGEIRMGMARSELAQQISGDAPGEEDVLNVMARQQLQREIGNSDLELTVTLGPETLSVEDIAGLRPGRMITLSSAVSTPVILWSGGIAAFEGSLARSGERLAIKITTPVS